LRNAGLALEGHLDPRGDFSARRQLVQPQAVRAGGQIGGPLKYPAAGGVGRGFAGWDVIDV